MCEFTCAQQPLCAACKRTCTWPAANAQFDAIPHRPASLAVYRRAIWPLHKSAHVGTSSQAWRLFIERLFSMCDRQPGTDRTEVFIRKGLATRQVIPVFNRHPVMDSGLHRNDERGIFVFIHYFLFFPWLWLVNFIVLATVSELSTFLSR